MKKILVLLFGLSVLLFNSCTKKTEKKCVTPTGTAQESELVDLRNYVESVDTNAIFDSRGFYYSVIQTSSEDKPGFCDQVEVDYIGSLRNGTTFDANNGAKFNIPNLILGFKYGLTEMGKNAQYKLYLPPSLGYGADDYQSIPGGSILIFNVKLISITKL